MRRVFDVIEEPRGDLLHRMITALGTVSSSVMVVLRDDLGLSEEGQALLSMLQPDVIEKARRSSWPGTVLFGEEATVLRFALSVQTLGAIASASSSLFAWQQPELPEDLCFLRSDGTAILVCISHENDAYFEVSDQEHQCLVGLVPEVARIVRPRAET